MAGIIANCNMFKKISLVVLILFYIGAGINHFWHQAPYLRIIPGYLPYPDLLNYIAGSAEIFFGLLLIFPKTRRWGACGIIALLILFIPVHIYMIKTGWCTDYGYCFPAWAVWLRLFPLQFLLMLWAWWHRE